MGSEDDDVGGGAETDIPPSHLHATDVPPSRPTSIPPFDPAEFAADVIGIHERALDDLVLACVPDVSWSEARLDFDELNVLRNVDAVSPVLLLETFLDMPREQLRSILSILISRGVLVVCEPAAVAINSSGIFSFSFDPDGNTKRPADGGEVISSREDVAG